MSAAPWAGFAAITKSSADRLFTIGRGGASIVAEGTGPIRFTGTGPIEFAGDGSRSFYLRGSNQAENLFAPRIRDHVKDAQTVYSTYLRKFGDGTWVLQGANTYTGYTAVAAGALKIDAIADGGQPSNIGASSAAAENLILADYASNAALVYRGPVASTNRLTSAALLA